MADAEQPSASPRRKGAGRVMIPRDDAERLVQVLADAEMLLKGRRAAEAQELIDRLGFRRFRLLEAMKGSDGQ
jgi:hypothetical protein